MGRSIESVPSDKKGGIPLNGFSIREAAGKAKKRDLDGIAVDVGQRLVLKGTHSEAVPGKRKEAK